MAAKSSSEVINMYGQSAPKTLAEQIQENMTPTTLGGGNTLVEEKATVSAVAPPSKPTPAQAEMIKAAQGVVQTVGSQAVSQAAAPTVDVAGAVADGVKTTVDTAKTIKDGIDKDKAAGIANAATAVAQDVGDTFLRNSSATIAGAGAENDARNLELDKHEAARKATNASKEYSWLSQDLLIRPNEEMYTEGVAQIGKTARAGHVGGKILTRGAAGASLGTSIMPGWGTLIGGVVGIIGGAIEGGIGAGKMRRQDKKAKQDAIDRYERRMDSWHEERQAARHTIAADKRQKQRDKNKEASDAEKTKLIGAAASRKASTRSSVSDATKKHNEFVNKTQNAGYKAPVSAAVGA